MRINVWIVLIVLIALFAVTRLLRYHQDTQRICADDARTLGVSVMTLHRWRKAPPGPQPVHEAGQPDRMRAGGDRTAELQLENSRLRQLVTDRLIEKVKLEEAAQRQTFFGVTRRDGHPYK